MFDLNCEVFSTCPQSSAHTCSEYLDRVRDVARWSEACGCKGILVYADNSLVDPWLVAQVILESTFHLCPLIAVQPVYMHPYTVAKMISTFAFLFQRRIYLNVVAGGFKNDLIALNDTTPHDKRYGRLVEYTTIIQRLLAGETVTYGGDFYCTDKLKLSPAMDQHLLPGIFISGSSDSGAAAAGALQATAIRYPEPPEKYLASSEHFENSGVRVGIIARDSGEAAWETAESRFPEDRKGKLTHELAMKVSDSTWHKQLSETQVQARTPYWLRPFETYKSFCPYLVGNYDAVGQELAKYLAVGHTNFILDIPPAKEELEHAIRAFECALRVAQR